MCCKDNFSSPTWGIASSFLIIDYYSLMRLREQKRLVRTSTPLLNMRDSPFYPRSEQEHPQGLGEILYLFSRIPEQFGLEGIFKTTQSSPCGPGRDT